MTNTKDIRQLPDGSIDYLHYQRLGRGLHGQAVRRAGCRIAVVPGNILTRATRWLFRAWAPSVYPSSRMSSKTL